MTRLLNPSSIIWTSEFVTRYDSNQHAQLHRLSRILKFQQGTVHSREQTTKMLISLHRHEGWSVLLLLRPEFLLVDLHTVVWKVEKKIYFFFNILSSDSKYIVSLKKIEYFGGSVCIFESDCPMQIFRKNMKHLRLNTDCRFTLPFVLEILKKSSENSHFQSSPHPPPPSLNLKKKNPIVQLR